MSTTTTTPASAEQTPTATTATTSTAGQGSAQRGAVVQHLRGMSYDAGAAALAPRPERGAAPVQKREDEGAAVEADEAEDAAGPLTLDDLADELTVPDQAELDELCTELEATAHECRMALGEEGASDLAQHCDGADALAGHLDVAGQRVAVGAHWEEDTLVVDEAAVAAFGEGVQRGYDVVELLDALKVAAAAPELRAIAAELSKLGAIGELNLSAFVIKAKTGADMASMLVKGFQEHQALFESRLVEAEKDTVGLLLGPLEKVGKAGKAMTDLWSYYQMWEPVASQMGGQTTSLSPWDAAKLVKTYGMAAAKPAAETMGAVASAALVPLGVLIDVCEQSLRSIDTEFRL